MEPAREAAFESAYRSTALLCVAIIGILPLLLFVSYVLSQDAVYQPVDFLLVWLGRFVALVVFVASFPVAPAVREAGIRAAIRNAESEGLVLKRADALVASMRTSAIVPYAMSEVPLLLGFVMFVLYGSWSLYGLFAILTAIGWTIHFPRKSMWRGLIDDAEAVDSGFQPIVS